MTLTSIVVVNAILSVAAVLGVFAIVRLIHRLRHDAQPETLRLTQPLPLRVVLAYDEREELAEAA